MDKTNDIRKFQPAIEIPINDHLISSHLTIGVFKIASRNKLALSVVERLFPEQVTGPDHNLYSTPT